MTMKSWSGVIALGMLTMSIGCARDTPLAPSEVNDAVAGTHASELTTTSTPVVTLNSDLTASPSSVTVSAGYRVLMVNESSRIVRMHSYDCSEFRVIYLDPGQSRYTLAFSPAGKTCNYLAWDTGWSRKIFEGQVTVQ
jgi:hypothetical protein